MNKHCVVTLGELMLRLSPPENKRFLQAQSFDVSFAGSEGNVAVSISNFGAKARYITKLPLNELGQAALNTLRGYGVDTSFVVRGGDRMGTFFLERGASQRASKVIYDRKNSAFALCAPEEFDWKAIFADATWFHFSGITPALSTEAAIICRQACQFAKDAGITISCDLNYRKNLWSKEQANMIMSDLLGFVDICFANESDISDVFDIYPVNSSVDKGILDKNDYVALSKEFAKKFHIQKVVISLRTAISANDNIWSAMVYNGLENLFAQEYQVHIVDRVGSGDSLAAAFIYAIQSGFEDKQAIEFATAASCLNHSIEGDFNLVTVDEVCNLMNGSRTGRIVR